jgi:hypothetical protein
VLVERDRAIVATFRRKMINEKCGKSGDFVFEISSSW